MCFHAFTFYDVLRSQKIESSVWKHRLCYESLTSNFLILSHKKGRFEKPENLEKVWMETLRVALKRKLSVWVLKALHI